MMECFTRKSNEASTMSNRDTEIGNEKGKEISLNVKLNNNIDEKEVPIWKARVH